MHQSCDICGAKSGGGLRVYTGRDDPGTGYVDSELVCGACIEDRQLGREESYCLICDARIRSDEEVICAACVEAAEEQHGRGRELDPVRKRPAIAAAARQDEAARHVA